ncbi:hypothetical protein Y027_4862 [Burkholderia pseudomallei TSV5]|nr:hypothetical protein DM75_1819 [Burkholderia mallei]KGS76834.1 hypothetical protein X942_4876 [Burkholderia pseudomallei MSHR5596]KGX52434.1 hypothetical protein Y027_4862 [Burkholderia pseudomallei TSV5]KGX69034.1 hypothetical protein Y026_4740 [Burkholderia pseudomallei TSV28]
MTVAASRPWPRPIWLPSTPPTSAPTTVPATPDGLVAPPIGRMPAIVPYCVE